MALVVFPYVQVYTKRGKLFRYYRRGGKRWPLAGDPGSVEFAQAYEAAKLEFEAGHKPGKVRTGQAPGSFAALYAAFRLSPEFRDKITPASRKHYDRSFAPLVERYGNKAVATMPRAWVIARRDELSATPRKADHLVAMIRRLLNWAVDHEWRKDNPALRIGTLNESVKHRAWTDAEIATMTGPEARTVAGPIIISLYTALRLGDVLTLPPAAYDGKVIRVWQSKTKRHKNATQLVIPVHPVLKQLLDKMDRTRPTICLRPDGQPWKIDHYKKQFAATRKRLNMAPDLHFHGLRGTAASRMAEGGASDQQIGAVTGHLSADMVRHYASGARQQLLAEAGINSLPQKAIKAKTKRSK